MTVSEAKESCNNGGSFTSHRGQNGKSSPSDESKIKKDNNHVDELGEELAHISLKESKKSTVDNEIEEKLAELSISSISIRKHEDKAIVADSIDKVGTEDSADEHKKSQSLKLNITEQNKKKESNETEVKEEKNQAQRSSVLDLDIVVTEESEISISDGKDEGEDDDDRKDGELCPRSPIRPEHAKVQCGPYQVTSRSRNHSSGGFCVAEPCANYSIDQSNWTNNLNIPIHFSADASYPSPPPYPFPSASTQADYTDEGVCDVLSPGEVYNTSKCEALPELCQKDLLEILEIFDERGIDIIQLAEKVSDYSCQQNPDDTCSPIPLSVAEFDSVTTENIPGSLTADYCPSSVSSGYHSCSPRSTNSTPSPSPSLKGSQEKINVEFNYQSYGNIGSVGYDSASPFQASPTGIDYLESSCLQTSNQILTFCQNPVYIDSSFEESQSSSVNFHTPETSLAPRPKPLAPKPTFSKGPGKERLEEKMIKSKKNSAWVSLSSVSDEVLAAADEDGDTHLMILLLTAPKENDCKLEMIYALVERMASCIPKALTAVNQQGQTALYLAALYSPDVHADLITRYIADTLLSKGASLDTVYDGGNTLLHYLCQHGAKRYKVLKELLTINKTHSCFNLDMFNDLGMTPLHVAVTSHQGMHLDCSATVRLLIEAGANATLLTAFEGRSSLHLAIMGSCDSNLIAALLSSPAVAATCGEAPYRQDTVLHLVAQRNDLPVAQQSKVYKKLIEQKAHKDARDSKGKLPLDLVAADRKVVFKQMIQQK